jgi:hypothetical protein
VVINNSSNINKGKTALSPKYTERRGHMPTEMKVLVLNRHKNMVGLNQLMHSETFLLNNWVSIAIDINIL